MTAATRQRLIERIRALGPRALAELLAEIERHALAISTIVSNGMQRSIAACWLSSAAIGFPKRRCW